MFSVGIKRDQWYEMGCKDKVILYKAKKKFLGTQGRLIIDVSKS